MPIYEHELPPGFQMYQISIKQLASKTPAPLFFWSRSDGNDFVRQADTRLRSNTKREGNVDRNINIYSRLRFTCPRETKM